MLLTAHTILNSMGKKAITVLNNPASIQTYMKMVENIGSSIKQLARFRNYKYGCWNNGIMAKNMA